MPISEKDAKELDLIAEFEMEYGQPDNWPDYVEEEYERRWDAIQKAYPDAAMYVCKNDPSAPTRCTPMAGIRPAAPAFRPPWLDDDKMADLIFTDEAAKQIMALADGFRERNKQVSQKDAYLLVMLGFTSGYKTGKKSVTESAGMD